MTNVFLQLVSLTKIISVMIIAVFGLRILFKKAPRKLHKTLWILVGIRASIPFYFRSRLGVIPAHTVSSTAASKGIVSADPITKVANINRVAVGHSDVATKVDISTVATYIWIAGVSAFIIYFLVNYFRTRRNVSEATQISENVFAIEGIPSPFILGYIKPRIYIYPNMSQNQQELIVAHERCHLKNMDHILKLVGFVLLSVYWFNPLMWLAYFMFCKDIELACDEEVIKALPFCKRKEYAIALLDSAHKSNVLVYGVAFSENNVKERVVSVMSYKKPKFWIIVAAVAACIVVLVVFFTVNKASKETGSEAGYVAYEFETYDGQIIKIDDSNIISEVAEEDVLETTSVPEDAEVISPGRDYVYLEDENYYYVEDVANGLLTVATKGELKANETSSDSAMGYISWNNFEICYKTDIFYAYMDTDSDTVTLSYDNDDVELAGTNVVVFSKEIGVKSKDVIEDRVKFVDGNVSDIEEIAMSDDSTVYAYSVVSGNEGSELKTEQTYYTIQDGDDVVLVDEFRTISPDEELDKAVSEELNLAIQSIMPQE